ncbi:MAG: ComF family protein [Ruminococcaceae bacterium]|nr:ComF family protein [Oscillospiraceae bacterium]
MPKIRIIDLLFPPRCIFCGGIIEVFTYSKCCDEKVKKYKLEGDLRVDYLKHIRDLSDIAGTLTSYIYSGPVAKSIVDLKFGKNYHIAREIAKIMSKDLKDTFGFDYDVVIPIPSYKNINRHSEKIAKYLSKEIGIKNLPDCLVKSRKTKKQHELTLNGRRKNLSGAFCVKDPSRIAGKKILLCDDVLTSGNTLNEAGKTLKASGAYSVLGVTFSATDKIK